jgi:hypothetical protein
MALCALFVIAGPLVIGLIKALAWPSAQRGIFCAEVVVVLGEDRATFADLELIASLNDLK